LPYVRKVGILTVIVIAIIAASIKWRSLDANHKLSVNWEGIWLSDNFRDAGESFNVCLDQPLMRAGLLLRSNRWFSGFSCDRVGTPDTIFSLNYEPKSGAEFFCHNAETDDKVIGQHFNTSETLHNLEFLSTWDNEAMRRDACAFLPPILTSLATHQRTLIHCNAGEDRTGTVSALLQALVAELTTIDRDRWLDAIECDYQKSSKLEQSKYGRQKTFLSSILEQSSIADFLVRTCDVPASLVDSARAALTQEAIAR
jgi:hypothetical protein